MRIFEAYAEPHGFIVMTVSDDSGEDNLYHTEQRYLDGTGPRTQYEQGTGGVCSWCNGEGRVKEEGTVLAKDEDGEDEIRNESVKRWCEHCKGSGKKTVRCPTCQGKGHAVLEEFGCRTCGGHGWVAPQKTKEKKT
jgi:DnaJ-class molecular chaperone